MPVRYIATACDGEVAGMKGALEAAPRDKGILLLRHSQAVIAVVWKAGRTGKARMKDLLETMREIKRRMTTLGRTPSI